MQKAASLLSIHKIPYDCYEFLDITRASCAKIAGYGSANCANTQGPSFIRAAHLKDENSTFTFKVTKQAQIGFYVQGRKLFDYSNIYRLFSPNREWMDPTHKFGLDPETTNTIQIPGGYQKVYYSHQTPLGEWSRFPSLSKNGLGEQGKETGLGFCNGQKVGLAFGLL